MPIKKSPINYHFWSLLNIENSVLILVTFSHRIIVNQFKFYKMSYLLIRIIFILFCLFTNQAIAGVKKVNVQQSVGNLLFLMPDLKIDFKVNDKASLGVIVSYLGLQSSFTGYAIGARVNYFLSRGKIMESDGFIINSYYLYHDHKVNRKFEVGPFTILPAEGVSEYGLLTGYQWVDDKSSINVRFSIGAKHISEEFILLNNKKLKYLPNAQLTVGVMF